MLRFSGQFGIGCEQCTSNLRSEEFDLGFNADILPNGEIGTVVHLFDQTFFIEQLEDNQCVSMKLLTADNLLQAGTLENISITDPDNISFSVELTGQEPEMISCDFCWFGPKPLCADEGDNGGDGTCVPFDLEELPNISCLAEFMLNSCDTISCGSEVGHVTVTKRYCEFVDCATLTCERIEFVANGFLTARPGTLTEIHLDELGELTATMGRDGEEAQAQCAIVVP